MSETLNQETLQTPALEEPAIMVVELEDQGPEPDPEE